MLDSAQRDRLLRRIRVWTVVFIAGLVLSGVTAFPLVAELRWLDGVFMDHGLPFAAWIHRVSLALAATDAQYPFLAYGTDWLAFGHLVIAVAFVGAYIDPVRNQWLFTWGLIACAGVLPLALIAGPLRQIPLYHRLIDCSFGIFGAIPLILCLKAARRLQAG